MSQLPAQSAGVADPEALYAQILGVLTQARTHAKRNVNQTMVQAYWQVGRLIVENEQAGNPRATYGSKTLQTLAQRLSVEFGKGFSVQSLRNFRQFFLTFTEDHIRSTAWSELGWSHFKLLMRVTDPAARQWYAREAVSQTWNTACSTSCNISCWSWAKAFPSWPVSATRDRALLENAQPLPPHHTD